MPFSHMNHVADIYLFYYLYTYRGGEGGAKITQTLPNFRSNLKNMPSLPKSVVYEKLKYRTSIFKIWRETRGISYIFVLINF